MLRFGFEGNFSPKKWQQEAKKTEPENFSSNERKMQNPYIIKP